jgi:hypothetical protein
MHDDLTPEQKFAAEDAETLVPRALLLGKTPDEIVADLMQLDWSPAAARALVTRVQNDMRQFNESPEARQKLIDAAFKQFIGGLLASIAAGIFVASTLFIAMVGGWCVVIPALFLLGSGITVAGRGWTRWRLYRGWQRHLAEREQGDVP